MAAAPRPQPSRATNAWASLPPLHVLHAPPTLVDWRFESQLTSWQHPMFGLKPLGHLRSPNAPGGMVVIEALAPPPAGEAPAAAARPAPTAEAIELPLPIPAPVAEQPAARAPAAPSDVDEWGFPIVDADPSFVQSLVDGPRGTLAYYPRFEPEPAQAAEPPAEGALRAVGAPEQAFFDSLRPRLEPIAPQAEEPRDGVAAPAPVAVPELPLAAPPPPAPEHAAEPGRMRVRFGEPVAPDAEPSPAPAAADVVAPPPAVDERTSAPPAVPAEAAEATGREPGAADVEAAAPPATLVEAPPTEDVRLDTDGIDEVAPVLAESEPLVAAVEAPGDEAPPAADTPLGEVPLDLAVRPPTAPEAEHPPVTAYFPPAEDFVSTEGEVQHQPVTAYFPPVEQAAPAGTEPPAPLAEAAAAPAAAVPVPGERPPAPDGTAAVPPPAAPEVLPLLAERGGPGTAGETAAPLAPPAPAAPAAGDLPLAPPSGPALAAPAPVLPPPSRGESLERGVPAAPPPVVPPIVPEAAPEQVRIDLPAPPPAAATPPAPLAPAPPPAARPAPDLTLAQPPRREAGQPRERAADAPEPAAGLRATVAPPAQAAPAPDMPLAASRPAGQAAPAAPQPRPAAEQSPPAAGEAPIVGEHPLTLTAPLAAPAPEGPAGGTPPEPSMPLPRSAASAAAPAATLVREQVSVAPLLGERTVPLHATGAEAVGPLDGGVAPLPEPAISVRVSRASDAAARQLQARAFTHEGEVHLSSASLAQGPREVEALVAHEMTHVLQQRILGPGRLPVESTSDGAALEAEARAVEQTVRSTGQFRLPQTSPVAMDLARYGTLMPGVQAPAAPAGLSMPQVTAPDDVTPAPLALPALTLPSFVPPAPPVPAAAPVPAAPPPATAAPPAVEVQDGPTFQWEAPWVQVQRAPDDDGSGGAGSGTSTTTTPTDHKDFVDQMHPVDKADLAEQLYPFIEQRLRNTLRRHRDRAARVTDMDL